MKKLYLLFLLVSTFNHQLSTCQAATSAPANPSFVRLATETYPGGGGGPTGGVSKAYVDAGDLATLFASTNYTDSATNALDIAHLAAISATNAVTMAALRAASLSSTNYTYASTLAATNFVKATVTNYLPLAGGTMTGNITIGNNSLIFDSIRSISAGPDDSMNFDANYYGFGGPGPVDRSFLTADGTPVVTSNMLNGVLAPATNVVMAALCATNDLLRAALDNEATNRENADNKLLTKQSPSYPTTRNLNWSGYNLVLNGPLLIEGWNNIKAGTASSNTKLPDYLKDGAWNTADDPFAKLSDIPDSTNFYPFAQGHVISNTVAQWEGYWTGSNVWWDVTNYLDSANNKIMRLYELQTNGVVREVWNDSDKYAIFFTNTLAYVSETNAYTREWVGTFVTNSLDAKADRAWGKYTSSGEDAPTNMVWHTAPTTVLAGGYEFKKVAIGGGTIGVLVSEGAVPYATGMEGKFVIGDGFGTNYFGYVKQDDYIIACGVDGITTDPTTKLVSLKYDLVFSGEYPIVYYSPTVIPITSQSWIQLNKADGSLTPGAPWPVTFSVGADYIQANISFASATEAMPPEGFFTSSTAVIGGGTFKTNMKADFLDAGLMCTNTDTKVMGVIRPTFDGTTVHWNWSRQ